MVHPLLGTLVSLLGSAASARPASLPAWSFESNSEQHNTTHKFACLSDEAWVCCLADALVPLLCRFGADTMAVSDKEVLRGHTGLQLTRASQLFSFEEGVPS